MGVCCKARMECNHDSENNYKTKSLLSDMEFTHLLLISKKLKDYLATDVHPLLPLLQLTLGENFQIPI